MFAVAERSRADRDEIAGRGAPSGRATAARSGRLRERALYCAGLSEVEQRKVDGEPIR
jgi:hypothetical protein